MIDLRMMALASVSTLALAAVPASAQEGGAGGAQQQDMPGVTAGETDRQPVQMAQPPGMRSPQQTVMLDIEDFSQSVYERGFRQGYIRGLADARGHFLRELARYNRRHDANAADNVASPAAGAVARLMAPEDREQTDRGAVVVLPPGMSAGEFIQQLQDMNDAAQRAAATPQATPGQETGTRGAAEGMQEDEAGEAGQRTGGQQRQQAGQQDDDADQRQQAAAGQRQTGEDAGGDAGEEPTAQ